MFGARSWSITAVIACLFAVGCSHSKENNQTGPGLLSNVQGAPASNSASAPAKTSSVTLPQGTVLDVLLDDVLSSHDAQRGQAFSGTLAKAVSLNGAVVVPAGAHVQGTVVQAHPGGQATTAASLVLALSRIELDGAQYPVTTSTVTRKGQVDTKKTAEGAGAGAAAGSFFGGLAAKGKGIFGGAKTGANAGASVVASVTNKDVIIGTNSILAFRMEQPITMTRKQ
jgi:hypothetical protein